MTSSIYEAWLLNLDKKFLKIKEDISESEDYNQEDNELNSSTPVVPKLSKASECTKILRDFFEAENNLPKNIFKYLAVIEDDIVKRIRDKRNQKLITDFFE